MAYILLNKDESRMVTIGWDGLFVYWNTRELSTVFKETNNGVRYHIGCMSHDERYVYAGDYNEKV